MDSRTEHEGDQLTTKVWGWSLRLFANDEIQVERIFATIGGYSSQHLHRFKFNQFIVMEGKLRVLYFDDELKFLNEDVLTPGTEVIVSPGVRHQFLAASSCSAYELYWAKPGQLDTEDIVRFSHNGVDKALRPPVEDEYRYCCRCNRPFPAKDLLPITSHNALRDICGKCASRPDAGNLGGGEEVQTC